jgi:hypothetical protein
MDMQMGTYNIYCTSHTYSNGYLYIYGNHFTDSSKIALDGKVMDETIFVTKRMLKIKIDRSELDDVTGFSIVQQVGSSQVELSSTPVYTLKLE